jgi:hypothetical protein
MFNANCGTDETLHRDAVTTELPTPSVVKYLVKNVAVSCVVSVWKGTVVCYECLEGHNCVL